LTSLWDDFADGQTTTELGFWATYRDVRNDIILAPLPIGIMVIPGTGTADLTDKPKKLVPPGVKTAGVRGSGGRRNSAVTSRRG
jgi:hypothetical protein